MRSGRRNSIRRGRSATAHPEDEATGLAGWMYTDLLLGLAVVFLGSISLIVLAQGSVDGDGLEEESESALESTTTTSTLPPEECTVLYDPASDSQAGIRIDLNSRVSDQQLAEEFRGKLTARLNQENDERLRPSGRPTFDFETLQIGIVIVLGSGESSNSGTRLATDTAARLRDLFPSQLGSAVQRPFWLTTGAAGAVRVEVFPTLTGECSAVQNR
jgi:hypothetical protein